MMFASVVVSLALAGAPGPERRAALFVGANAAPVGRATLRYAFRDAEQLRDALVRVGGVRPEDALLLRDPTPAEVLASLKHLGDSLSASGTETVLYFYYSGHADDSALYPGGAQLPMEEVRRALIDTRVTVKIGIIDACSGGGWTRAKGLTPAPAVAIKPLTLSAEGSVLIASSSGLEEAHESELLAGSFFTHHLVAGLLGAADSSNDGVVSATEAFTYAQAQTVRATARAAVEPQHPSFEWNLRGRRDLALAQLTDTSTLTLNQSVGPLQVVELPSGLVLLELPEGERRARLAVPPGTYLIRRVDDRQVSTAREVQVVAGKITTVEENSLELVGRGPIETKSVQVTTPVVERQAPEVLVPAIEESILPAHTLSVAARGGFHFLTAGSLGLQGSLRASWAPADWVEIGFFAPSVTFLVGQRHANEVILFAGFDSLGVGFENNKAALVFSARVAGLWRHWFSGELSLLAGLAVVARSDASTGQLLGNASVGVTWTLRKRVSLNLAVGGVATLRPFGGVTIGSPVIGGRVLPLVDVHLTPNWSLGFDFQLTARPNSLSSARTFLSLAATW
jgi:hypothetical protein